MEVLEPNEIVSYLAVQTQYRGLSIRFGEKILCQMTSSNCVGEKFSFLSLKYNY